MAHQTEQLDDGDARVRIGQVLVDSGRVIIADPSFLEHGEIDRDQLVAAAFPDGPDERSLPHLQYSWFTEDGQRQIVVADSGHGVGAYDVFAVVRPDGLVRSVEIIFIEDEPDDMIDEDWADDEELQAALDKDFPRSAPDDAGSLEGAAAEAGRE